MRSEDVAGQRDDLAGEVPGDHVHLSEAGNGGRATQPHDRHELVQQHVDHAHDALVPKRGQGIKHRANDSPDSGAEGHGHEDVGTAPDSAVEGDADLLPRGPYPAQSRRDLGQRLDAGAARAELQAAEA